MSYNDRVLILSIMERENYSSYKKCHRILKALKKEYGYTDAATEVQMEAAFSKLQEPIDV